MYVVKIGGSLVKEGIPENIAVDISDFARENSVVVVHGGGDKVTEIASRLGKEQKFIVSPEGIRSRYTDKETSEIYTMVMAGLIGKKIVATLQKYGVRCAGLSGLDSFIMKARRKTKLVTLDHRGRKVIVDGGYTGTVTSVNSSFLLDLLNKGIIPVISPIAIGEDFEFLNVDGDRAASAIASSLRAKSLIILTNVDGLILEGKVVREIRSSELRSRLREIGFGMQKKVIAASEAVEKGVGSAIICSGLMERPVTNAVKFSTGTVVLNG
jgi:acetylglutamate/LysW-gamma-L-alpha-aminoadipate kinase